MKYVLSIFFILAGINHFRVPEIYLSIIPPYLPYPLSLNYISGLLELISGILLIFNGTQKTGSMLIIAMLLAFIPAHIYMIQIAPFYLGKVHVQSWAAWLRIPLQFLLIWWASHYYKAPVPLKK
jgi:uncharacterized membrane protein